MADEKYGCDLSGDPNPEYAQWKHLLWITFGAIVIMAVSLFVSPYLFPTDPEAFYRYVLLKVPLSIVQSVVLLMGICLADLITPRHSLDCISKEPMSNSVFYSAFVIALAMIMTFG